MHLRHLLTLGTWSALSHFFGQKSQMQAKSAVGPVDPADAPKVIAEAVGRLSARQAFDLLTQLKVPVLSHSWYYSSVFADPWHQIL